jgi:hypothetical protein
LSVHALKQVAGRPLIPGVDARENLDARGLEALAKWD